MFFEAHGIPGISALHRDWRIVRDEFKAGAPGRFVPWKERHIYHGNWDTIFLVNGYKSKTGHPVADNSTAFPETMRLIAAIPGVLSAGFSRLGPHTRIIPHRGFDPDVLRVHLGIEVPDGCWLASRWERRYWVNGGLFAFDDTRLHMVENPSPAERIVLILDINLECRPHNLLARQHSSISWRDTMCFMAMLGDFAHRRLAKALAKRLCRPPRLDRQ